MRLPHPPVVIAQALEAASAGEQPAEALARALETDTGFSHRLLRIANSAFYGLTQPVETVLDAIMVIGFDAVHSLAISAAVIRGLWTADDLFDPRTFWKHSLTVGRFAEVIAEGMSLAKPATLFTLGVLHDAGRIILIQSAPKECREVAKLLAEKPMYRWKAERQVLGFDHAEIGAGLVEKWGMPAPYVEAIRCHHDLNGATQHRQLAHVLALADALSHRAFSSREERRYVAPVYPGLYDALGLDETQIRMLLERREAIERRTDQFYNSVVE
ncbi:HDOD domain-containing protein [bacterium]|nr:HDOD domain-containing protein [bacterium]